ncbi:MAG: Rne/Rng family ribonuclease [Alphaproteobacteria bacterium]|nr:Rne/Rng family ribonuclease [Rickettsiales bacterium]
MTKEQNLEQKSELVLIDSVQSSNLRIAIIDNKGKLEELFLEGFNEKSIKNNIYLGTVARVEHSLQCAFIDFGGDKNGFLPFSEIHLDYYQLPSCDKTELMGEASKHSDDEHEEDNEVNDEENNAPTPISHDKNIYKKYNIQEVIKRGQNVLVQVYKDSRGNKGVSLTTYVSLAGRYCVFMPNSRGGFNISRKILDPKERHRILDMVKRFPISDGMSVVVRTAGMGIEEKELEKDFLSLIGLWNEIRQTTLQSKTQSLVYSDSDPIKQVMRDRYSSTVEKVIIEGSKYQEVVKLFNEMFESEQSKVVAYKGKKSLFSKYGIEKQIDELLSERVELESGGYLIINQTEALVAVDVNSGRATGEKDVESTALQINLEAAVEVARQLRLRELGGLIVIDFIDMLSAVHRKNVENTFNRSLGRDRAKTRTSRISMFGLLECSRQRLRTSVIDMLTLQCPSCYGIGRVRSGKFVTNLILRSLQNCTRTENLTKVEILCSDFVAQYLLFQSKEAEFTKLVKEKNFETQVKESSSLPIDAFVVREVQINGSEIKYKILDKHDGCIKKHAKKISDKKKHQASLCMQKNLVKILIKTAKVTINIIKQILDKIFS